MMVLSAALVVQLEQRFSGSRDTLEGSAKEGNVHKG